MHVRLFCRGRAVAQRDLAGTLCLRKTTTAATTSHMMSGKTAARKKTALPMVARAGAAASATTAAAAAAAVGDAAAPAPKIVEKGRRTGVSVVMNAPPTTAGNSNGSHGSHQVDEMEDIAPFFAGMKAPSSSVDEKPVKNSSASKETPLRNQPRFSLESNASERLEVSQGSAFRAVQRVSKKSMSPSELSRVSTLPPSSSAKKADDRDDDNVEVAEPYEDDEPEETTTSPEVARHSRQRASVDSDTAAAKAVPPQLASPDYYDIPMPDHDDDGAMPLPDDDDDDLVPPPPPADDEEDEEEEEAVAATSAGPMPKKSVSFPADMGDDDDDDKDGPGFAMDNSAVDDDDHESPPSQGARRGRGRPRKSVSQPKLVEDDHDEGGSKKPKAKNAATKKHKKKSGSVVPAAAAAKKAGKKRAVIETSEDEEDKTLANKKSRKKKGGKEPTFAAKGIPQPHVYRHERVEDLAAESPEDKALRRSKRTRIAPLDFWRGERPEFGPNDLHGVSGCDHMPQWRSIQFVEPTPYKPRKIVTVEKKVNKKTGNKESMAKESKTGAKKGNDDDTLSVFDRKTLPKKHKYMRGEKADVWDDCKSAMINEKVVSFQVKMVEHELPLPKDRPKTVGKVVGRAAQAFTAPGDGSTYPGFIMGNLTLPPKGFKDPESVGNCTQTFTYVSGQRGALEVAYADPNEEEGRLEAATAQRFLLSPGDCFHIVPGNAYQLQNHSSAVEAVLTWTIIRPVTGPPSPASLSRASGGGGSSEPHNDDDDSDDEDE